MIKKLIHVSLLLLLVMAYDCSNQEQKPENDPPIIKPYNQSAKTRRYKRRPSRRCRRRGVVIPYRNVSRKAYLIADAGKLKGTIVTAHLEQRILRGQNILWCNTFQLAWNKLKDRIGKEIKLKNAPQIVSILNRNTVSKDDLDEDSFVAMAGFVRDGIISQIRLALKGKYQGQAPKVFLEEEKALSRDDLIVFAYLFKQLPFQWTFKRFKSPMSFRKGKVASFGFYQFQYKDYSPQTVKAARQVLIQDYKNDNNFILELKVQSKKDRLILAKVPASSTLLETVRLIKLRLKHSHRVRLHRKDTLQVPVLDFDIRRDYSELPKPFVIAQQQIRFRLNEKGAVLKSRVKMRMKSAGYVPRNLIFNKPFLILLIQKKAQNPYFALWVDNSKLLVPFKRQ